MKEIKSWTIKCSVDSIDIKAFEDKNDAIAELKKLRKLSKEDGLTCTHKIIPCKIIIK